MGPKRSKKRSTGDPNPQGTQVCPIFNYFSPLAKTSVGAAETEGDPAPSWPHGAAGEDSERNSRLSPALAPREESTLTSLVSPALPPQQLRDITLPVQISLTVSDVQKPGAGREVSDSAPSITDTPAATLLPAASVKDKAPAIGGTLSPPHLPCTLPLSQGTAPISPLPSLPSSGLPDSPNMAGIISLQGKLPEQTSPSSCSNPAPLAEGVYDLGLHTSDEEDAPLCTSEVLRGSPLGPQPQKEKSSTKALSVPALRRPVTSQHLSLCHMGILMILIIGPLKTPKNLRTCNLLPLYSSRGKNCPRSAHLAGPPVQGPHLGH